MSFVEFNHHTKNQVKGRWKAETQHKQRNKSKREEELIQRKAEYDVDHGEEHVDLLRWNDVSESCKNNFFIFGSRWDGKYIKNCPPTDGSHGNETEVEGLEVLQVLPLLEKEATDGGVGKQHQ